MGKPLTQRQKYDRQITEAQVQRVITDALDTYGWLWHHETDSRKSKRGFPDICAVHPRTGAILFLELKKELGVVSPEQQTWLDALNQHGPHHRPGFTSLPDHWHGYHADVVRPSTLDDTLALIKKWGGRG